MNLCVCTYTFALARVLSSAHVCVHISVCLCFYVYVCLCVYACSACPPPVYVYGYIHDVYCILVCMCLLLCMHVTISVHVYVSKIHCVCVFLCGSAYKYGCVFLCAHISVHTHVCVCVCVCTDIWTHGKSITARTHAIPFINKFSVSLKYFKVKSWRKRCWIGTNSVLLVACVPDCCLPPLTCRVLVSVSGCGPLSCPSLLSVCLALKWWSLSARTNLSPKLLPYLSKESYGPAPVERSGQWEVHIRTSPQY